MTRTTGDATCIESLGCLFLLALLVAAGTGALVWLGVGG